MDLDDLRSVLEESGVDVWTFIDTAIAVAAMDYGEELKLRRDKIVEALYTRSSKSFNLDDVGNVVISSGRGEINGESSRRGKEVRSGGNNVSNNDGDSGQEGKRGGGSPSTPPRLIHGEDEGEGPGCGGGGGSGEEEEELDPYGGLFDDEQKKILDIKQQLEDPDQSEDMVVDLLQCLADMDITFTALKETDIGRNVNRLRKHPSNDVRRLVKQLVRKWKVIVDDWVRLNPQGDHSSSALMADGDSPQQKIPQNVHHQVRDFAYSPNPHNGSSGSDKNNSEPEREQKPIPRKGAPIKPVQPPVSASASAPHSVQRKREQPKESNFDVDARLASARKRLQANYKEAENAKRQRTIQVMDIHEIPKPKSKNTFFAKNKGGGGGGSQGRHW